MTFLQNSFCWCTLYIFEPIISLIFFEVNNLKKNGRWKNISHCLTFFLEKWLLKCIYSSQKCLPMSKLFCSNFSALQIWAAFNSIIFEKHENLTQMIQKKISYELIPSRKKIQLILVSWHEQASFQWNGQMHMKKRVWSSVKCWTQLYFNSGENVDSQCFIFFP